MLFRSLTLMLPDIPSALTPASFSRRAISAAWFTLVQNATAFFPRAYFRYVFTISSLRSGTNSLLSRSCASYFMPCIRTSERSMSVLTLTQRIGASIPCSTAVLRSILCATFWNNSLVRAVFRRKIADGCRQRLDILRGAHTLFSTRLPTSMASRDTLRTSAAERCFS